MLRRLLSVSLAVLAILALAPTDVGAVQEKRGCCSHHHGVCGCEDGVTRCCDGSPSPTCTC